MDSVRGAAGPVRTTSVTAGLSADSTRKPALSGASSVTPSSSARFAAASATSSATAARTASLATTGCPS